MKKSEQMLFALLRASLHEQEVELDFFQQATDEDWKQCHQTAIEQGVMALAWDGVLRLPAELMPSRQGVYAMTQLCNRYLGTSVPVDGGEKIAEDIMKEIMNPKFVAIVPINNKIGIIFYKLRRLLYRQKLKNTIFHEPLIKRLWISTVNHIRKPESIFSKKPI